MTIFISHAAPDQPAAEALEAFLERRGHFVERDDGEVALAPVAGRDVVVVLISSALAASAQRLRLAQRALDAWSVGRLVIVALDETPAPIGLRDLPALDAKAAEAREPAWAEVAAAITHFASAAPSTTQRAAQREGARAWGLLAALALIAPGLFALAAAASIWLVNRIGPSPGGMAETLAGIESFGHSHHLPAGLTPLLFAAAIVVMLAVLIRLALKAVPRTQPRPKTPDAAGDVGAFVSAAPADGSRVAALVEAARGAGAQISFHQDLAEADRARAIDRAQAVLVMCSPAAYQSDQVERDLFLADRSGKRIVSVLLDPAPPTEDFAYFFSGQSGLALHALDGGDRARALAEALRAAPSIAPARATQE